MRLYIFALAALLSSGCTAMNVHDASQTVDGTYDAETRYDMAAFQGIFSGLAGQWREPDTAITEAIQAQVRTNYGQTVGNAFMGYLGDRLGHRLMLIAGALAVAFSSILAWYAPSVEWLYPVFVLAGLANVSFWTIGMAITVQFGRESERPVYIGLSNTLIAPATILAPILGGWMADSAGFELTFLLSAVGGVLTALLLLTLVKDPQQSTA